MTPDNNAQEFTSLTFFNSVEARTVNAIAARNFPGDPTDPGAREAGVVDYIDRSLAGFLKDLQTFYRRALQELDDYSRERHGAAFSELAEEDQDRTLSALDSSIETESREYGADSPRDQNGGEDDEVSDLLTRFFSIVREHVLQGMFCDPVYGGNRDVVGWRLLGFPGAQWGYSADQMKRRVDAREIPVLTLGDLRLRHRDNWTEGTG